MWISGVDTDGLDPGREMTMPAMAGASRAAREICERAIRDAVVHRFFDVCDN